MGKELDAVDRVIDGKAIIFGRCLDMMTKLVGGQISPQFYGPEPDPGANEGTLIAASHLFNEVVKTLGTLVDTDAMIAEYAGEAEEERRLARDERERQLAQIELEAKSAGSKGG
jgi:hypothetical protein